ncbi:uncharacterized protein LOC114169854 isoform X8 [Vigna unguiculata]|nr:uncharacterized protein LOC114169854 isoform X8 [Vigna unguiculata]
MDNNNWRPNQGTEANMDISDWRGGMQQESRQRIVNRIMDTLKRHLPISGQEGLHELQKIAQRFEEKIFSAATSQSDYLRKISLKMLTMETKSQGNMANAPNQGGPSNKPPNPVHWRMCKRCGNMRRLACSTCKGTKSIREGGLLGMKLVKDLFETLDHTESQPLASALDLLNIEMIVGNWQLLQVSHHHQDISMQRTSKCGSSTLLK